MKSFLIADKVRTGISPAAKIFTRTALVSELPDAFARIFEPISCASHTIVFDDRVTKKKKHRLCRCFFFLVTRTGIEPMFPA